MKNGHLVSTPQHAPKQAIAYRTCRPCTAHWCSNVSRVYNGFRFKFTIM